MRIERIETVDMRFPTARNRDGSDAMNVDPDYSAAYVILGTQDGLEGHGLTFTIGRGNDLVCRAIEGLAGYLEGRETEELFADMAATYRLVTGDSQWRWLGPEKGVVHLAAAALLNAVWDLRAKHEGKPLWRLLSDMSPREIVRATDFRYIEDALSPAEAEALLERAQEGKAERTRRLVASGYPAYTTSAGWLGYPDDKIRALARRARDAGFHAFKLKVGADLADDLRRIAILRDEIGPDDDLMIDANQVWGVDEAIAWACELAPFGLKWVEEPTSPDDILGHARIDRALRPLGTRVATGEHAHNRVMFKQFLQADALGYCQLDACRLGGIGESLAVILMAAKFGVPIAPHGGGVGLCEYIQHLAMWDYVAVSGAMEGRLLEYVDHLHEHFVDPVRIVDGRYAVPEAAGCSIMMKPGSVRTYRFPDGDFWLNDRP